MPILSEASAALKELRDRAGFSVRGLADAIGWNVSKYATYENNYKKPYLPVDLVMTLRPILLGRGDPPITDPDVSRLAGVGVGLFGLKDITTGDSVASGSSRPVAIVSEPPGEPAPPADGLKPSREIDELDAVPQAGNGSVLPDLDGPERHPVIAKWTMPEDFLGAHTTAHGKLVIIRVSGDSMEPDYPAGERILVDTSHQVPSPPGVYVLWDGFGLVLKRVEILLGSDPPRVRIKSINPAYDTYERALDEVIINGRVVGKWVWK